MYDWLELAGFVRLLAAKGSKAMPVLLTVQAQLSLHNHNIAKEPEKQGNAKKSAATVPVKKNAP